MTEADLSRQSLKHIDLVLFVFFLRLLNCCLSIAALAFSPAFVLFFSRRRQIARRNVEACWPGIGQLKVALISLQIFRNYIHGIFEALMVWFLPKGCLLALVRLENGRQFQEASKHGSLILCPHYSFLELAAVALYKTSCEPVFTYRPHESKIIDRIMTRGRARYGKPLSVEHFREAIRCLKRGQTVWIAPDQDKGIKSSVFSKFFNIPAATVTTPARLARVSNVPVFFMQMDRHHGIYRVNFIPLPESYPSKNEVDNANTFNSLAESAVSDNFAQYMWLHRRFKTQPNLERYQFYK